MATQAPIDLDEVRRTWLTWDQVEQEEGYQKADTEKREEILDNWISLSNLLAPTMPDYEPEEWTRQISSFADQKRAAIQQSKGFGERAQEYVSGVTTSLGQSVLGTFLAAPFDTIMSTFGAAGALADSAGKLATGDLDTYTKIAPEMAQMLRPGMTLEDAGQGLQAGARAMGKLTDSAAGYADFSQAIRGQGVTAPGERRAFGAIRMFATQAQETLQNAEVEHLTPEAHAELQRVFETPPPPGKSPEDMVRLRRFEMEEEGSPYRRDTPLKQAQAELKAFLTDPANVARPEEELARELETRERKILELAREFWGQPEGLDGTPFEEQEGRRLGDETNERLINRFQLTRNPMYLDALLARMSRSAKDVDLDRSKAELTGGLTEFEAGMMEMAGNPIELAANLLEINSGIGIFTRLGRAGKMLRARQLGRAAREVGTSAIEATLAANAEGLTEAVQTRADNPLSTDEEVRKAYEAGTAMGFGFVGVGAAGGAAANAVRRAMERRVSGEDGAVDPAAEAAVTPEPETVAVAPRPSAEQLARRVKAGLAGQSLSPVTDLLGAERSAELSGLAVENFREAWAQGGISKEEKAAIKGALGLPVNAPIGRVHAALQAERSRMQGESLRMGADQEAAPRRQVGTVGARLQEIAESDDALAPLAKEIYERLDDDTRSVAHTFDDSQLPPRARGKYIHSERRVVERSTAGAATAIHEATHAKVDPLLPRLEATGTAYLQGLRDWAATPEQAGTPLADLVDVYTQAVEALGIDPETLNTAAAYQRGGLAVGIREFLPEVFSNQDLQQRLDGVSARGKKISLFRALVDAVRRVLGLSPKAGSLLERSLQVGQQVIEMEAPQRRAEGLSVGLEGESFSLDPDDQIDPQSIAWRRETSKPSFLKERKRAIGASGLESSLKNATRPKDSRKTSPASGSSPTTDSETGRTLGGPASLQELAGRRVDLFQLRPELRTALDTMRRKARHREQVAPTVVAELRGLQSQFPGSQEKLAAREAAKAAVLEGYRLSGGERIWDADAYFSDQPDSAPGGAFGADRLAAIEMAVETLLETVPASALGRRIQFAYRSGDGKAQVAERVIREDPDKIVISVPEGAGEGMPPIPEEIIGAAVHALSASRRQSIVEAIRETVDGGVITHVAFTDASGKGLHLQTVEELVPTPGRFSPYTATKTDDAILYVRKPNGRYVQVQISSKAKARAIAKAAAANPGKRYGEIGDAPPLTEALLRPALEAEFRDFFDKPLQQIFGQPGVHTAIAEALRPSADETARSTVQLWEELQDDPSVLRERWTEAEVEDEIIKIVYPPPPPPPGGPRSFEELSRLLQFAVERIFDSRNKWRTDPAQLLTLREFDRHPVKRNPWLAFWRRLIGQANLEDQWGGIIALPGAVPQLEHQVERNAAISPRVRGFLEAHSRMEAAAQQILRTADRLQALRMSSRERLSEVQANLDAVPGSDGIAMQARALAADVATEALVHRAETFLAQVTQKVIRLAAAREARVRRRTAMPVGTSLNPFERVPRPHFTEALWYYTSPLLNEELEAFGKLLDAGAAELQQISKVITELASRTVDWMWLTTQQDILAAATFGDAAAVDYLVRAGIAMEDLANLKPEQIRAVVLQRKRLELKDDLAASIELLERGTIGAKVQLAAAKRAAAALRGNRLQEAARIVAQAWTQRAELAGGSIDRAILIDNSVEAAQLLEEATWSEFRHQGDLMGAASVMDWLQLKVALYQGWGKVREAAGQLNRLEKWTSAEVFRVSDTVAKALAPLQEVQQDPGVFDQEMQDVSYSLEPAGSGDSFANYEDAARQAQERAAAAEAGRRRIGELRRALIGTDAQNGADAARRAYAAAQGVVEAVSQGELRVLPPERVTYERARLKGKKGFEHFVLPDPEDATRVLKITQGIHGIPSRTTLGEMIGYLERLETSNALLGTDYRLEGVTPFKGKYYALVLSQAKIDDGVMFSLSFRNPVDVDLKQRGFRLTMSGTWRHERWPVELYDMRRDNLRILKDRSRRPPYRVVYLDVIPEIKVEDADIVDQIVAADQDVSFSMMPDELDAYGGSATLIPDEQLAPEDQAGIASIRQVTRAPAPVVAAAYHPREGRRLSSRIGGRSVQFYRQIGGEWGWATLGIGNKVWINTALASHRRIAVAGHEAAHWMQREDFPRAEAIWNHIQALMPHAGFYQVLEAELVGRGYDARKVPIEVLANVIGDAIAFRAGSTLVWDTDTWLSGDQMIEIAEMTGWPEYQAADQDVSYSLESPDLSDSQESRLTARMNHAVALADAVAAMARGQTTGSIFTHPDLSPSAAQSIDALPLAVKYKRLMKAMPWTSVRYTPSYEGAIEGHLLGGGFLMFRAANNAVEVELMRSSSSGESLSLGALASLIVGARNAGFTEVRTLALSAGDATGYKTWPALGFDFDKSSLGVVPSKLPLGFGPPMEGLWTDELRGRMQSVPPEVANDYRKMLELGRGASLLRLTATPEGRKLWAKYGKDLESIPVTFDLRPGSKSIKRFAQRFSPWVERHKRNLAGLRLRGGLDAGGRSNAVLGDTSYSLESPDLSDSQVAGLYAAVQAWVEGGGKIRGEQPTAEDARRMLAGTSDQLMVQVLGLGEGQVMSEERAQRHAEELVPVAQEVMQFFTDAERNGQDPVVIAATYQQQNLIRDRIANITAAQIRNPRQGRPVSLAQIRDALIRRLEVPLRFGIRRRGRAAQALGIFAAGPDIIRLRHTQDVETLAHEIGHWIHYVLMGGRTGAPRSPDFGGQFDGELMRLGQATSLPGYTPVQIRNEGVAEFVRYFLADPMRGRQLAPTFHQHFTQFLKANDPRVLEALTEAQEMITAYIEQPEAARLRAQVDFNEGPVRGRHDTRVFMDGVRDWWRTTYTKLFNGLYPIERVTRQLVQMGMPQDQAERFAELAINHQGGAASAAEADLYFGQRNLAGRVVGRSLRSILEGLNAQQREELSLYMVRKRADELEARQIQTGVPPVSPAQMKEWEGRYESRRQALLEYQRNLLQLLVESGILGQAEYARMMQANQDYVPFYRVFEEIHGTKLGGPASGVGFVNLQSGLRQIRGSDRLIVDPLESIIKNTYLFRSLAQRNQVGRSFTEAVESMRGHGVIMDHVATKMAPVRVPHQQVVDQLVRAGVVANAQQLTGTNLEFNLWQAMQPNRGQGEFVVWRNGRREMYQVHDPLLYDALTFADAGAGNLAKALGPLFPVLRAGAAMLRLGATYTPGFTLANWLRDQFVAGVQSRSGYIPFADGIRGAYHVVRHTREYQDWVANGGRFSGITTSNRDSLRGALEELTGEDRAAALALIDPRNLARGYARMMDAINEVAEEATRMGEYLRARGRGLTPTAAVNRAKDVTLNFSRGGAVSRTLNAMIAFFNVGMQDFDKVMRAFADPTAMRTPEGRREIAAAYLRGTMMVTVPSVLTWWMGKDDEELQNLAEWRKNYFWNINLRPFLEGVMPGQPHYIVSFPKPFLVGAVFGTQVERALDQWYGNDPKGVLHGLQNSWSYTLFHGDIVSLPSIVGPMMEMRMNYSTFSGGPIVPQRLQGLPAQMQFTNTTSGLARAVGESAASVGLEVSPIMVDHLIRGHFASLGGLSTDAIDALGHLIGYHDRPDAGPSVLRELAGVQRFRPKDLENTRYVELMFRGVDEAKTLMAPLSEARLLELPAGTVKAHVARHQREIAELSAVVDPRTGRTRLGEIMAAQREFSEITKAMRLIEMQSGMPAAEKQRKLYQLNVARNRVAEVTFRMLPESIRKKVM